MIFCLNNGIKDFDRDIAAIIGFGFDKLMVNRIEAEVMQKNVLLIVFWKS